MTEYDEFIDKEGHRRRIPKHIDIYFINEW